MANQPEEILVMGRVYRELFKFDNPKARVRIAAWLLEQAQEAAPDQGSPVNLHQHGQIKVAAGDPSQGNTAQSFID